MSGRPERRSPFRKRMRAAGRLPAEADRRRQRRRDEEHETGRTGLGEVPVPPLVEINTRSEFVASHVSAEGFERAWARALRGQPLDVA
ncbi:DUF6881 domain-containing protein [Streptoalloteichus tenebrarius]|uniref:DUF6881 domain-containing protein n=1 Tax=Streptoalloteichus tenebrarius (strain ATCC 17920 / DSM 40477 / JCM 4838 / CBS 697.72 / NBRC 16177 / NCIMB 11028 / NRRL B-12390 / A12253. 1 / ISP 5477) TaxID=1933 RepID=UPI0035591128